MGIATSSFHQPNSHRHREMLLPDWERRLSNILGKEAVQHISARRTKIHHHHSTQATHPHVYEGQREATAKNWEMGCWNAGRRLWGYIWTRQRWERPSWLFIKAPNAREGRRQHRKIDQMDHHARTWNAYSRHTERNCTRRRATVAQPKNMTRRLGKVQKRSHDQPILLYVWETAWVWWYDL